jgi:hypothetical protein
MARKKRGKSATTGDEDLGDESWGSKEPQPDPDAEWFPRRTIRVPKAAIEESIFERMDQRLARIDQRLDESEADKTKPLERERRKSPGRKAGLGSQKDEICKAGKRELEEDALREPDDPDKLPKGRGRRAELARRVHPQFPDYDLNTIARDLREGDVYGPQKKPT